MIFAVGASPWLRVERVPCKRRFALADAIQACHAAGLDQLLPKRGSFFQAFSRRLADISGGARGDAFDAGASLILVGLLRLGHLAPWNRIRPREVELETTGRVGDRDIGQLASRPSAARRQVYIVGYRDLLRRHAAPFVFHAPRLTPSEDLLLGDVARWCRSFPHVTAPPQRASKGMAQAS